MKHTCHSNGQHKIRKLENDHYANNLKTLVNRVNDNICNSSIAKLPITRHGIELFLLVQKVNLSCRWTFLLFVANFLIQALKSRSQDKGSVKIKKSQKDKSFSRHLGHTLCMVWKLFSKLSLPYSNNLFHFVQIVWIYNQSAQVTQYKATIKEKL